MEPVPNREFLLQFFNNGRYTSNNINNFYIYNNVINNYYIYNTGFQAGVVASTSASPSETFERLRIDVSQVSQDEKEHGCEDTYSCSICQNEQEEEEEEKEMVTTKCNHVFHSTCLKKWVLIKTICPMCRASLIKNQHQ
jgi:hypothetical protein